MSKHKKLTDLSKLYRKDTTYTYTEQVGAILGQIARESGRVVSLAPLNRYLNALGLENTTKEDLLSYIELTDTRPEADITKVFNAVASGKLDLYDVVGSTKYTYQQFQERLALRVPAQTKHKVADQSYQRAFNKALRNGAYMDNLMEELQYNLGEVYTNMKPIKKLPKLPTTATKDGYIILGSDWHLGAEVDVEGNTYNYAQFKKRWDSYLGHCIQRAKDLGYKRVYFFHIGDVIEQIAMRNVNQPFETEFTLAQEISLGIKHIFETLQILQSDFDVVFGMVTGNHDRMLPDKKAGVYNDSAVYIMLNQMFLLKELGQLPRVSIIDNRKDTYDLETTISGKLIHVTHGEKVNNKDNSNISNFVRDKPIDILIYGHYHSFRAFNGNHDQLELGLGAIMGFNNYSKEHAKMTDSGACQCSLEITDHGYLIEPYFFNDYIKEEGK